VNERQAYALTHPADDPNMVLDPRLKTVRKHARGFLLMAILAVDR
jgi:hypothetical protein